MMYHSSQQQYKPLQTTNPVKSYSFVRKPQIQKKYFNLIQQKKCRNNMITSQHDFNETINFTRSNYSCRRLQQPQQLIKNYQLNQKQVRSTFQQKELAKRRSLGQKKHSHQKKHKYTAITHQPTQQNARIIYKQIIQVIQNQNRNLKEHNKFLLNQYKRIQQQNSNLKQKIELFEFDELEIFKIENNKLKQMHEMYKKEIQELKYILLQQMVQLHQKFHQIIGNQQGTNEKILEFAEQLKYSQTFTLNSAYFKNNRKQNCLNQSKNEQSSQKCKLEQMVLSQIFSYDQKDHCNEGQRKFTFQTTSKENDTTSSNNFDLQSIQGPQQARFSNPKIVQQNRQKIMDCKTKLRNNIQKIIQQIVKHK